jgi:hypothetical protein
MLPTTPAPSRPTTRTLRHVRRGPALVVVVALAILSVACSSGTSSTATTSTTRPTGTTKPPAAATGLPPIRHVFVIVLENEGYADTFGTPAADPYLATTLPASGATLTRYYGIGHFSNDNYIALISGQAPNPSNQSDCQVFADFPAGTTIGAGGQIAGSGCVFPAQVATVADQMDAAHLTWKAYMQDMGNVPTRESAVCGHPAVGAVDQTQRAVPGDGYATRHDPFVYFHSIIDDTQLCDSHVVPLGSTTGTLPASAPASTTGLATDLASVATTPNLSFITPNLCSDGHDAPCTNQPGAPTAGANIDAFLSTWVPMITHSPAFRKDGLLIVTFDEADVAGPNADATACCNEQPGPAAALPGGTGPGGGRTGTVLVSPFIRPGTVSSVPYNHYSTLGTIESLFGLTRLGQAATVSAVYGRDIFSG